VRHEFFDVIFAVRRVRKKNVELRIVAAVVGAVLFGFPDGITIFFYIVNIVVSQC